MFAEGRLFLFKLFEAMLPYHHAPLSTVVSVAHLGHS